MKVRQAMDAAKVKEALAKIRRHMTYLNDQLDSEQQLEEKDFTDQVINQYADGVRRFNTVVLNGPMTAERLEREYQHFHAIFGREGLIRNAGKYSTKEEEDIETVKRLFPELFSFKFEKLIREEPVRAAAHVYVTLVNSQPFSDGNKRAASLIMNYVLMKAGYMPFILTEENAVEYMRIVLRTSERTKINERRFREFLQDEVEVADRQLRLILTTQNIKVIAPPHRAALSSILRPRAAVERDESMVVSSIRVYIDEKGRRRVDIKTIPQSSATRIVIEIIKSERLEGKIFLIGGAVTNIFLGAEPEDIDWIGPVSYEERMRFQARLSNVKDANGQPLAGRANELGYRDDYYADYPALSIDRIRLGLVADSEDPVFEDPFNGYDDLVNRKARLVGTPQYNLLHHRLQVTLMKMTKYNLTPTTETVQIFEDFIHTCQNRLSGLSERERANEKTLIGWYYEWKRRAGSVSQAADSQQAIVALLGSVLRPRAFGEGRPVAMADRPKEISEPGISPDTVLGQPITSVSEVPGLEAAIAMVRQKSPHLWDTARPYTFRRASGLAMTMQPRFIGGRYEVLVDETLIGNDRLQTEIARNGWKKPFTLHLALCLDMTLREIGLRKRNNLNAAPAIAVETAKVMAGRTWLEQQDSNTAEKQFLGTGKNPGLARLLDNACPNGHPGRFTKFYRMMFLADTDDPEEKMSAAARTVRRIDLSLRGIEPALQGPCRHPDVIPLLMELNPIDGRQLARDICDKAAREYPRYIMGEMECLLPDSTVVYPEGFRLTYA